MPGFERIAVLPSGPASDPGNEPFGRYERRWWPRDLTNPSGGRKAGAYQVFVPAPIARRSFPLGDATVAAIADATRALQQLIAEEHELVSTALARTMMRSESTASSRIEGIRASQRTLARAAYARAAGRVAERRASEILGNVDAMDRAIELGFQREPLSVAGILDIHRTLLRFGDDAQIAGRLRSGLSWIGGNDHHPIGAAYVGPPPELVPGLLDDLSRFAARTDVASVAQAAIAHAQFEHIHPFADGNGRTGRALVYTVLRKRDEVAVYAPPISHVLAARPRHYVRGLEAYRAGDVDAWCTQFALATTRAVEQAQGLAARIRDLQEEWLRRLGQPRSDAAARAIVAVLPGNPVIDVGVLRVLTGKSHVALGRALAQLERAGILTPLHERRWGRAWECGELLEVAERFEQEIDGAAST